MNTQTRAPAVQTLINRNFEPTLAELPVLPDPRTNGQRIAVVEAEVAQRRRKLPRSPTRSA